MAILELRYTTLLFKAVKNTCQKRKTGSSAPSDTSEKYHRVDSCPGNHDGAMLLHENTNSNDTPITSTGLAKRIPTITLNDDEVPLVPSHSSISDPFVDQADTASLLDLSTLRSNATALRAAIDTQRQGQTSLQAPLSQPHPFRVIIVGAGPNGLLLAHALHQAGIDYIILERSQTIPNQEDDTDDTTALVLWPHSARILDQLGLLRRAKKLSCPMRTRQSYLADGTPCPSQGGGDAFARSRSDHGRSCMLISRAALLRLLGGTLPERDARCHTGREVTSVETRAAGVSVTCADGSVEEGSIVVGCDGTHGVVRQAVGDLRAKKKRQAWRRLSLGRIGGGGVTSGHGNAERDMEARFYGLVGSAPLLDGLEPGVCYETRGGATGTTFQVHASKDTAYFLAYIRLNKPTYKRTSYTVQNADFLASALAANPVTDKIKFGDLWRARRSGKMVDFHEGLAEKWYHDRVVLAGDEAHSMSPFLGLGVNTGWQGVAELTNSLRRLLVLDSNRGSAQAPDTASLRSLFKKYQNDHDDTARRAMLISSFYTRAVAQQGRSQRTPLDSFYGWATPDIAGDIVLLERQAEWSVRLGITLDFLEEKHFKEGKLKWVNPRRRVDAAPAKEKRKGQTVWVHPGIPMRVRAT